MTDFNANHVLFIADNVGTITLAIYARQDIIFLITYVTLAIFPTATRAFHRWLTYCAQSVTQATFSIVPTTLVYPALSTAPFVFLPLNAFCANLVSFSIQILLSVSPVLQTALFVIPILLACSVLHSLTYLSLLINVSVVLLAV